MPRENNTSVGRSLSHPVRLRLWLEVIEQGKASPSMAAASLKSISLPAAAYHMRELYSQGVLKKAGTRPARGAVEHFYEAKLTPEQAFEKIVAEARKL